VSGPDADAAPPAPTPSADQPGGPTPAAGGPGRGSRSPLVRDPDDRIVSGVCAGVAHAVGADPAVVRIATVALSLAGGVGIALYLLAWSFSEEAAPGAPPPPRATAQQTWAIGLITLGVLLLLRDVGVWFGDAIVLPLLLALTGSAVLWVRSGDEDRERWAAWRDRVPGLGAGGGFGSPVRLVVGLLLVGGGLAAVLATTNALLALRAVGLALLVAVVGLGLVFGPWVVAVVRERDAERRERIRTEERAEVAAHLHDSVLQTLALIQRSADQPRRMVALARSQERDLRAWLYGRRELADEDTTLRGLLDAALLAVESAHDLDVDLVVVGDAPADDDLRALVAAVREALVNTGRHSGAAEASVYVEVEADEVTAFVRDRGRGFDPTEVADDRRGVADSIRGRLGRHGGRASLRTAPGEGTEWELVVPRRAGPGGEDPDDASWPVPTPEGSAPSEPASSPPRRPSEGAPE
jgi:signal transduction histidine kinase